MTLDGGKLFLNIINIRNVSVAVKVMQDFFH